MSATTTLEELKGKLYKAFDDTLERRLRSDVPVEDEAGFFAAAGHIAQAIVAVESKIDERKGGLEKGLKG